MTYRVLIACDGQHSNVFLAKVEPYLALKGMTIILAHIVDSQPLDEWTYTAERHLLHRPPHDRQKDPRHTRMATSSAQDSSTILEEARALVAHWPVADLRVLSRQGNPERTLVALAESENAALIVVGVRGQEVGPRSLGRCARYVIDHAPCDVLGVKFQH